MTPATSVAVAPAAASNMYDVAVCPGGKTSLSVVPGVSDRLASCAIKGRTANSKTNASASARIPLIFGIPVIRSGMRVALLLGRAEWWRIREWSTSANGRDSLASLMEQ